MPRLGGLAQLGGRTQAGQLCPGETAAPL